MKGGDGVIVLVATFVVKQRAMLHYILNRRKHDMYRNIFF